MYICMDKKSKKAFTLVELVVTIAVIGILAAITVIVLPSAVKKANRASAFSDDRNTVTYYEEYAIQTGQNEEAVIIVDKSDSFYVYGYSRGKKLNQSINNAYEAKTADELLEALLTSGDIEKIGDVQTDITEKMDSRYKDVSVYTGYRLVSLISEITIPEDVLYIGEDESLKVETSLDTFSDIDSDLLMWKSSDEQIVSVENGMASGVSPGEAVVTVSYGNKSASVNVTVIGYTDFSGTLQELKDTIENSEIPLVMLRLQGEIQHIGSTDFLPITISSGNRVRILTSDEHGMGYISMYADNDENTLFLVDGGSLYMKSMYEDFAINVCDRRNGAGDIEITSDIIVNRNNGRVELYDIGIARLAYITEGTATISGSAVRNESGECILYDFLYSVGSVYDNAEVVVDNALYNGDGCTMNIGGDLEVASYKAGTVKVCIENRGQCKISCQAQETGRLEGETPIVNYGKIDVIENLKFSTPSTGIGIVSIGSNAEIGKMENCEFNIDGAPSTTQGGQYCMSFAGGATIKHIANSRFSFSEQLILADDVSEQKLNGMVTSGEFSKAIPDKYIKSGHTQYTENLWSGSMYFVVV